MGIEKHLHSLVGECGRGLSLGLPTLQGSLNSNPGTANAEGNPEESC